MNIGRAPETLTPASPSLLFEGRSLDRPALDERAGAVSAGLEALDVVEGDRVALVLPNVPEFVFAYLGTVRLGAVAVSVNPRMTPEEIDFILRDSGARAALTLRGVAAGRGIGRGPEPPRVVCFDEGWPPPTTGVPPILDVGPDHPAAIVYTSGTTGTPKGATLSHRNVLTNARAKRSHLGIRPDDRLMLFLPLFHCFGQNAVLNAALQSGASVVLHRAFEPETILRSVVEDRVTMFFAVPPVYRLLLEVADASAFPDVRLFFSAAAPLPRVVEDAWTAKFGRPILQGYGLTETSPFASYNHRTSYRPGSIGTSIEGVSMKVVSLETGEEQPTGQVGQIAIRGPNVMLGYWNRPEETREVVRDGWFHTGDVGMRDEEGYFFLLDRVKDMINTGGLKAYPAEIESILGRHPAVAEAAVFGIPDEVMGEVVAARVVPRPDARVSPAELTELCRSALAPHKVPGLIELSDSLPKGPTGKVLKRVLREEFQARGREASGPEPASPDAEAIRSWLARWLADRSGGERDSGFSALGLSSLEAVGMMRGLSDFVGHPLSASMPWVYPTVETLAARVAELIGSGDPGDPASTPGQDPRPSPGEPDSEDALLRLLAREVEDTRRYLNSSPPRR